MCHLLALADENSQSSGHCRHGPPVLRHFPLRRRPRPLSGLGWLVTALTRKVGPSDAIDVKEG